MVSDEKLLLVAVCVLTTGPCRTSPRYLCADPSAGGGGKLDRLRLIHLLPGNRIRLNVALRRAISIRLFLA